MDNDTLLGKAPIPRAVAAMAIPSVISSLVTVVYNMADTFFVGQTGDALQVAAVSLTNTEVRTPGAGRTETAEARFNCRSRR